MTRRRSSSVNVGIGGKCPKCASAMRRFEHPKGWQPRSKQPYYFRFWDRCGCGHLQHYESAKAYPETAPARPARELSPDQAKASRALREHCKGMTSKQRRQWLAEQMGIEERFAIIADFDAVECQTVIEICDG